MAKTFILEYPDDAPFERIKHDLDILMRGPGGIISSPVIKADAETDDGAAIIAHFGQQGRAASDGTVGTPVGANQYLLTNGVGTQCGTDTLTFTIAGGVITDYQVTGGS